MNDTAASVELTKEAERTGASVEAELRQILQELGLADAVRVE